MSDRNRFFTSSNPFVREESYAQSQATASSDITLRAEGTMTIKGAVTKTAILTLILVISAFMGVAVFASTKSIALAFYIPTIVALGAAFGVYMSPRNAAIIAPIYAVSQGMALGTVSFLIAAKTGLGAGIIINAVLLTMMCLVAMLVAYRTGLIRPTEKFKSIITTATMAIGLIYMVSFVGHMFGAGNLIPYLHEGGVIGIGLSLVITGIAALNLIIDFESFENGEAYQAPKYMEWVSAVGLLSTLVWLYMEILRLLSKFSSND